MEEITMERLLTNFNEVVNEFKELVDNKDIASVKKALAEVEGLLANEQGIELDRVENEPFDHVLHHFLSSIGGVIEKEEIKPETPDITLIEIEEYRARILILLEERTQIENELKAIEAEEKSLGAEEIEKRIAELEAEIARREEAWENTLQYTENADERKPEYDKVTDRLKAEAEELKRQLQEVNVNPNSKIEDLENKIAEREAEIARREEAWENTLQYTENADERKPEYDKVTDRLKAELEEFKRQLQEVNVNPNSKIEDLENKIAEREAEIARREEAWENTLQYTENAEERKPEYDKVTDRLKAELEKLKSELENERVGQENVNNVKDNSEEIERLKKAIEEAYEELKLAENGKFSPANSQWRLDLVDHIDLLKRKLAELENSKVQEKPLDRKEELLNRLTLIDIEINELTIKITEFEGREGVSTKETFDVTAEAQKIGDKVFKTAEIRKELAERNVSREDFLQFYKEGLKVSDENIQKLKAERHKLETEVENLFTDKDSDETLINQLNKCKENDDQEQRISIYEKMRKNFVSQGYNGDLFDKEITTKEEADQFAVMVEQYINSTKEQFSKIGKEIEEQNLNKRIFSREIGIIEKEKESINLIKDEKEGIEAKASREKDLRARQIRATMFGDEELEKEYDERFERFYSHKTVLTKTYIDENGEEQEVEYESIEKYPEYEEDAFFLNLEDYKRSLETVTKYRNSDNDLYALGTDFVELLKNQPDKEQAIKVYQEKLRQAEEYVETFHGHTNKYKVKYENYKNAGSTLKGMVPVKDLPPLQKMGAATENVFRFFGIRKPEFSRIDENGNKVRDIKGGAITTAIDALVVGGVALGIASGPIGIATVGVAYAARGVVTLGNLAAAEVTKARHGEDIENNRPTPYSVSKDDKEVARKDYYRKDKELGGEGLGKFRSWLKAKNDKYFFKDRAKETEERIVNLEIENAKGRIDRRTVNAKSAIDENVMSATKNQQRREDNYLKVAKSQETYNDMIRDPESVDKKETASIIAQNAAVRSYDAVGRDVNPNSEVENKNQYVKQDPKLEKTEDLKQVVIKGGTTAATAITEEEKYTARQQLQDRRNRVATIVLTIAGKFGLDFAKEKFIEEVTTYKQGPDTIEKEPIYGQEKVTEMPEKITDLKLKEFAHDNIYDGDTTSMVGDITSSGNPETMSDPVAVAIRYVTEDGKEIGVSIAEDTSGLTTTHPHVNMLTSGTLRDKTFTEIFDLFEQINPTDGSGSFADIVSQPEFAGKTTEEIIAALFEKDSFWIQNSNMNGWQNMDYSKMATTVEDVIIGYKDVVVPGPQTAITSEIVNYRNMVDSAIIGAIAGTGVTASDILHEATHQTKKRTPGEFDVKNPTYTDENTIMDIIERRQRVLNKQREEFEDEQR